MIWILYATLLTLLNLALLLVTLIGVPGTWLMLALTGVVAYWQRDQDFIGWPVIAAGLVLALLGELIEFLAGVYGSKRFGGTNWGAVGAVIGTLVGGLAGTLLLPLPLIGSLVGACVGAALGAIVLELWKGGAWRMSLNSGVGAGIGRLAGTLGKVAAGAVMWLLFAVAAFWP